MFKKVCKSVSISTIVLSPDPLSLTPLTFTSVKTFENAEEDPDDSEPPDEWDTQTEYSFD